MSTKSVCDCCSDEPDYDACECFDGMWVCWYCYTVKQPASIVADNERYGRKIDPKLVFGEYRKKWLDKRSDGQASRAMA